MHKSPRCFLPSFKSIGISVQEKKLKINFQDGGHGSHLGFPIRIILAIFDLQVTLMLPARRRSIKYIFKMATTAAILDFGQEHAIFDLQVTAMLPSRFQVSWHFGSGEEANIRFSRWPPRRFQVNGPFSSGEGEKYIFKMAATVAILHFQLEQF